MYELLYGNLRILLCVVMHIYNGEGRDDRLATEKKGTDWLTKKGGRSGLVIQSEGRNDLPRKGGRSGLVIHSEGRNDGLAKRRNVRLQQKGKKERVTTKRKGWLTSERKERWVGC